jgi:rhodanese-related sulfurtransferase
MRLAINAGTVLGALLLLFAAPFVCAQEGPTAQSMSQCSARDIDAASSAPGTPAKRDESCYIDTAKALELARSSSPVLVDVRGKDEYERFHFPEAVRLSMSEIRTKTYLSSRTLLIYGSGKTDRQSDGGCAALRGHGFRNARIVSGGILGMAKLAQEQGLIQAVDFRALAELSAEELFAETHSNGTLIVSVASDFSLPNASGKQIRQDSPLTPENLLSTVRKAVRGQDTGDIRRLVLIGVKRTNPGDLNRVLSASVVEWPVFAYLGDQASYESSVSALRALWDKKAKGPVVPKCGVT